MSVGTHTLRLEDLPGRVFLDTSVVNFILDFGEQIHENLAPPDSANERVQRDIAALRDIFFVGTRAQWQLVVSARTWKEIWQTRDTERRQELDFWLNELWQYWQDTQDALGEHLDPNESACSGMVLRTLDCLPDRSDRELLIDAIGYRCDLFCTRDWKTILKHRPVLNGLPITIVSPTEWWDCIQPYAALFV